MQLIRAAETVDQLIEAARAWQRDVFSFGTGGVRGVEAWRRYILPLSLELRSRTARCSGHLRGRARTFPSNASAVTDALGAENQDKIRAQILARADEELGGGKAKKLFINDFVVQ